MLQIEWNRICIFAQRFLCLSAHFILIISFLLNHYSLRRGTMKAHRGGGETVLCHDGGGYTSLGLSKPVKLYATKSEFHDMGIKKRHF